MNYTEKRLELFSEEELIIEVMEDYISVIEDTHTGFLNDKVSRRRECFDKLKLFIAESIHQAIAEDRKMVVDEIKKMNNLRQGKIDGKDDWNNALEQSYCKIDSLFSYLRNTNHK